MHSNSSCEKSHARLAKIPQRVLVVDDEPLVRWSLAAGLRAAGFEALAVGDADEALALARTSHPDVVLLDIKLWNTDPLQLLTELRCAAPDCRFLMLAVTGHEIPFARFDGVEIIRKPYDLHEVVRIVRSTACSAQRMKAAG